MKQRSFADKLPILVSVVVVVGNRNSAVSNVINFDLDYQEIGARLPTGLLPALIDRMSSRSLLFKV